MFTIKYKLLLIITLLTLSFVGAGTVAHANTSITCEDGRTVQTSSTNSNPCVTPMFAQTSTTDSKFAGNCKKVDLSQDCGIIEYLKLFINVLSGIVGVVIVIMITVGGIQYSAARDNPQAVAAAKGRIINAIIALVAYLFLFAFLQYLVPGGVL